MATSLQGGHWEATLFSPGYNLDWIKSCSIFSQPWQLLFLNDTWYHHAPSAPLPSFSQRHTWRGGVHGRRRNCWGLLQMRGQTPRLQHPCRAHTHNCLQVFVEVCVTCHLACDTRRESLRLAVLVVRAKWCIQSAIDRVCFFLMDVVYYAQVYVFSFSSLKCHLTFLEVKSDHIWMSIQSATQPANAHLSLSSWMGY